MDTSPRVAGINGARISIITTDGCVLTTADKALVKGAGVAIVKNAQWNVNADARLAEINGAGAAVIANNGSADAIPVYALVNRARVDISAVFRSINAGAIHACINGAKVIVVACDWRIGANPVNIANIISTWIIVIAF